MNDFQLQSIQDFVYKESVNITDPQHGLEHAQRVKSNAAKIAQLLELDQHLDLNLLIGMSLLHDMHYSTYSPGIKTYLFEGRIAKKFIKEIISQFNLTAEEKDIVIEAIASHTHSYPFRKLNRKKDLYTKILQDADTLDFFSDLRLKALTNSRNKFFFYKLVWKIGQRLYYRNKKQINKYLNYPQLVSHLTKFNIS